MFLLVCLGLAALAPLVGTHALARRWPRCGAFLLPALLALLVGKAVLDARPQLEWWLLPWPGYALVQGFVLYGLAAAFFGVAAARLTVRWNRVVVLLVGLGVLGHGVRRHTWLAWPEVHGDTRTADAEHHLRQSTVYTCGPAACCAALAHLGAQVDERTMAAACLTRRDGTRLFDLYRGLVVTTAGRPLAVSIEDPSAAELLAADHVVVCSNPGGGHALCVVTRGGRVLAHDPMQAHVATWSPAELQAQYRGPAIVLRPLGPVAAPR